MLEVSHPLTGEPSCPCTSLLTRAMASIVLAERLRSLRSRRLGSRHRSIVPADRLMSIIPLRLIASAGAGACGEESPKRRAGAGAESRPGSGTGVATTLSGEVPSGTAALPPCG